MCTCKRLEFVVSQAKNLVIAPFGLIYFFASTPVVFPFSVYAALLPFDSVLGFGTMGTFTRFLGIATIIAFILNRLIVAQGRILKPPLVVWSWAMFLLLSSLSSLWAMSSENTFRGLFTLTGLFLIYLCVGLYPIKKKEVEFLKSLIIFSGFAAAIFSLVLYIYYGVTFGNSGRASLVFGEERRVDPNHFAASLVLPLIFALEQMLRPNVFQKRVAFASTLVILLAILATGSRGGILGTTVAMLFFLGRMRKNLSKRSVIVAGIAIGLFITMLALMFLPQDVIARFNFNVILTSEGAGRFSIWKIGLAAFLDNPLLGYGYENFPYAYDLFYSRVLIRYDPGLHRPAHNIFLQVFVELGIVGGVLLIAVFWQHWRLVRRFSNRELALRASEAMLLGLFVASLTLGTLNQKYFWLAFSLILALINAERRANWEAGHWERDEKRGSLWD